MPFNFTLITHFTAFLIPGKNYLQHPQMLPTIPGNISKKYFHTLLSMFKNRLMEIPEVLILYYQVYDLPVWYLNASILSAPGWGPKSLFQMCFSYITYIQNLSTPKEIQTMALRVTTTAGDKNKLFLRERLLQMGLSEGK